MSIEYFVTFQMNEAEATNYFSYFKNSLSKYFFTSIWWYFGV
jgi:hypothetical protein